MENLDNTNQSAPQIKPMSGAKYQLLNLLILPLLTIFAVTGIGFIIMIVFGVKGYKRYSERGLYMWKSFGWIFTMMTGIFCLFLWPMGNRYFKEEMARCKTKEEMKKTAWDMFFVGYMGLLLLMLLAATFGLILISPPIRWIIIPSSSLENN